MDPQAPTPEASAARCALHVGQPFTTICPRCGTYMCSVCSENGRFQLCAACRERTGTGDFPLRRESWTLGALMRHSYGAYRRNLATVTLASLIVFAIIIAINFAGTLVTLAFPDQAFIGTIVSVVLFIPQMVIQGGLTLGMSAISLAAARGETPDVAMIFSKFARIGAWVVQSLVMYLAILPPALLVAIPAGVLIAQGNVTGAIIAGVVAGIPAVLVFTYVIIGLLFGNMELVHDERIGALAALKSSWRMATGQRWAIFGCGVVFFAVMLAGVLACFVGVIFAMGFAGVMFASLFLALKNGLPQDA